MKKKAFECLTHILHECRTKKAVALQRVVSYAFSSCCCAMNNLTLADALVVRSTLADALERPRGAEEILRVRMHWKDTIAGEDRFQRRHPHFLRRRE
eukprot:COSAG04_NODE_1261_length_7504_cov_2.488184_7_plen_97_part_00